jgi:hypothetical protein
MVRLLRRAALRRDHIYREEIWAWAGSQQPANNGGNARPLAGLRRHHGRRGARNGRDGDSACRIDGLWTELGHREGYAGWF